MLLNDPLILGFVLVLAFFIVLYIVSKLLEWAIIGLLKWILIIILAAILIRLGWDWLATAMKYWFRIQDALSEFAKQILGI